MTDFADLAHRDFLALLEAAGAEGVDFDTAWEHAADLTSDPLVWVPVATNPGAVAEARTAWERGREDADADELRPLADVIAERDRLALLKVWGPVTILDREIKDRTACVELAQDAYYYGTAADLRATT